MTAFRRLRMEHRLIEAVIAPAAKERKMASDHARDMGRTKIKQLLSTPAKAWWHSAADPNIRALKVAPENRMVAM
jgi:hypothetical protein